MFAISVTIVSLCSTVWFYLCAVRSRGRPVPTFMCGFLLLSALVVEKMGAATTAGSSGACATCPLPTMDSGSEERFLIEVAKKQILSKLHLRERPNITQTVPRAALLTALRKLHAGRVRQDGTLDLDNHLPNAHAKDQAYEIVSFADMDDAGPGLSFQFSQQQGQSTQVLQSSLWVYVLPADSPRPAAHVPAQVYLLGVDTGNRTLLLQRNVEVVRGGWHTFPLTSTLQAFLDGGQQRLRLEVRCGNGDGDQCARAMSADPSRQPFLVAQVRLRDDESKHALSKRSLRCGDDISVCCKKDFYIKFRDIQWQDWIIAPEGYHMNYCMGQCPQHLAGSPGIASSFHATVFSQLKANGIHATISSCCVPIQRRPLSMVYFNSQHSIVKTDVPDMIVETCGCT